ncbi:MAG: phenylalanine--tRNA ligase subunit alpha [Nitrospiraceae bacterium]
MAGAASPLDSLHPLEVKVCTALKEAPPPGSLSEEQIAQATSLEPSQLSMAVEWLLTKSLIRVESHRVIQIAALTEVGEHYFEQYAPLERILSAVQESGRSGRQLSIKEFESKEGYESGDISSSIGSLKKEGVIRIVQGGYIEVTGKPSVAAETLRAILQQLHDAPRELQLFSEPMRQLIEEHAVKRGNTREPFRIIDRVERQLGLTPEGAETARAMTQQEVGEEVSQLTPDMLKDGSWRTKRFRKYTISLRAPRFASGKRHPYREFLDLVKTRLVSMGFQEMRGSLIETEFWNMDALYMPQFHPARDIHDVYFVKHPTHARTIAEPYFSQVAAAHRNGGKTGSTGWGYQFDENRARRLVLRSQGTAVSARTLAAGPQVPGKYFSIARCFRYDRVDATHATDFFQVEGIVLGQDITFRTLLGLLDLFAREVAQARDSRFLPAYFPFTEPSVELHVRHPRLGWIELGGAGLFRPEVTRPLGVEVPVIAWGLGLDRMAMVALGLHDIRDLFSSDLEMIRGMRAHF